MSKNSIIQPAKLSWKHGVFAFVFLFLCRIPFLSTGHLKDESFVFLQCAKNMVEHGELGFNLGERVSSCSSFLYVWLLAIQNWIVSDSIITSMILVNSLLTLLALALIAFCLARQKFTIAGGNRKTYGLLLFLLIGLSPISLLISYAGMETPVYLMALAILGLPLVFRSHGFVYLSFVVTFLLAFIRPEAFLVGFVLATVMYLQNRKWALQVVVMTVTGIVSLLLFNFWYFGQPIPQHIIANMISWHPDRSFFGILVRLGEFLVFPVPQNVFNPFTSNQSAWLAPFIGVWQLLGILYLMFRSAQNYTYIVYLLAVSLFFLLFYAVVGVESSSYTWPITMVLGILAIKGWLDFCSHHGLLASRLSFLVLLSVVSGLASLQYLRAIGQGDRNIGYKESIVSVIQQTPGPKRDIMLEAVGYIPFQAGLYTHDQHGQVQPKITLAQRRAKKGWWIEYLQEEKPDLILDQLQLGESLKVQTELKNESDMLWFRENYREIQRFSYRDYLEKNHQGFFQKDSQPGTGTRLCSVSEKTA